MLELASIFNILGGKLCELEITKELNVTTVFNKNALPCVFRRVLYPNVAFQPFILCCFIEALLETKL